VEDVCLVTFELDNVGAKFERSDADRAVMVHGKFVLLAHFDRELLLLMKDTRLHGARANLQSM